MWWSKANSVANNETVINKKTLEVLTNKAGILDQLIASNFQDTAHQITQNANSVNQSSSQRLANIENNLQLVEQLVEQSAYIADLSS